MTSILSITNNNAALSGNNLIATDTVSGGFAQVADAVSSTTGTQYYFEGTFVNQDDNNTGIGIGVIGCGYTNIGANSCILYSISH